MICNQEFYELHAYDYAFSYPERASRSSTFNNLISVKLWLYIAGALSREFFMSVAIQSRLQSSSVVYRTRC